MYPSAWEPNPALASRSAPLEHCSKALSAPRNSQGELLPAPACSLRLPLPACSLRLLLPALVAFLRSFLSCAVTRHLIDPTRAERVERTRVESPIGCKATLPARATAAVEETMEATAKAKARAAWAEGAWAETAEVAAWAAAAAWAAG